jgi:chromate transporter
MDSDVNDVHVRELVPCTLWEFVSYFLYLGALGFGGPIALAGYMQRDLVERRRVSPVQTKHGAAEFEASLRTSASSTGSRRTAAT